ncbi:Uncharacterized protein BM_BM441 [Brugia malayi]|uniref:Bm441 n=2 Tax=Brugia TaxID=6278 RepID=A0A0J9XUC4_BRUMA|nr:Uncharacterized protein BM_BM441 [Brugia malayi]CDP95374.1 Bm441 [Brugia malayi]VDO16989.1 unnamed protein product [Brugia timori]VIO97085.1 Uncharacterized protein BM_BM441 [Brugia malayi]
MESGGGGARKRGSVLSAYLTVGLDSCILSHSSPSSTRQRSPLISHVPLPVKKNTNFLRIQKYTRQEISAILYRELL